MRIRMISRIVPSMTTPQRGCCSDYKRLASILSSTRSKKNPAEAGFFFAVCTRGRRLPIGDATGLRMLFGVRPEYLVSELFLLLRHHIIQVLKGRNEFLHMLCMLLGQLFIGLLVLQRIHRVYAAHTLEPNLVNVASVIAHDLRKLIPLRALSRGNAQLRVQLFDPLLDPFLSSLPGNRMARQWRGWRSSRLSHIRPNRRWCL